MDLPVRHAGTYVFERFRLDPVSRTLSQDGHRIPLPARLFDTLLCLVANHDRLIPRDELLQTVWPSRNVDAGSLGRAVSSLRDVLRTHGAPDTLIVTAPGRGYRLGTLVEFELSPPANPDQGGAGEIPPAPPPVRFAAAGASRPRILAIGGLAALAVLAVAAVAVLQGWLPPAGRLAPPPPHTVAVLPFANLDDDRRRDTLADGLAEELIDELGSVPALHVAARMSSFSFRGRPVPIAEIARQLRVGAVLDGSIRRDGARVRVTVRLVDAVSGYQIWSRSYDRDQSDILSLEGQIAEAVIASLKIVLLGDETAKLRMGGTADPRAFDAYLAGVTQLSDDDHAANRRAMAAASQAIALDPDYALAYALRARALTTITADGEFDDPATTQRMYRAARQDAERAVALAPELGIAHATLAFVLNATLTDFGHVAAEYARAVALAPGNATILLGYARLQLQLDHLPAALAAAQHAADLDPLTPATYRALARVLTYARRYDEALLALDRARRLPPADPQADRIARGHVETLKGDATAAVATCGGALDMRDDICLAWAYHQLGRQADAEAALVRSHGLAGDNAAYIYANILASWGRQDEALHWLGVAYRLRDPGLVDMKISPMLAPLRKTALYLDIERKLGFPEEP